MAYLCYERKFQPPITKKYRKVYEAKTKRPKPRFRYMAIIGIVTAYPVGEAGQFNDISIPPS